MRMISVSIGLLLVLVVSLCANRELSLKFDGVADLNDYLRTANMSEFADDVLTLKIELTKTRLLDCTVELGSLRRALNLDLVSLEFGALRGFVVGPSSSSPVLDVAGFQFDASNYNAALVFIRSTLELYDERGARLSASCVDYVAAYYGLNPAELATTSTADKTALLRRLRGLFAVNQPALQFSHTSFPADGMCPLLFKDSRIRQLTLDVNLQDNRVRRELFAFSSTRELLAWDAGFDLNCSIVVLDALGLYRLPLEHVLRPPFLSRVRHVIVRGTLLSVSEPGFFASLPRLKYLEIYAYNLREFLHATSDNAWLASLNQAAERIDPAVWCSNDTASAMSRLYRRTFQLIVNDGVDDYEPIDADFCLFRRFPHEQAVFWIMRYPSSRPPSCLYWYLTQYSNCYYLSKHGDNATLSRAGISSAVEACDFTARLNACELSLPLRPDRSTDVTVYDWTYALAFAEFVGPVLTFPLVSTAGFLLNALAILVIQDRSNQSKHFKGARIYALVQLNSAFNAVECLLSALTLMNECLGEHSIFCSAVQRDYYVQLFKVLVVQYVGEAMKTCSIVAMLAFSVERYLQTTGSNRPTALSFSVHCFATFAIVFGLLTSTCKLYEYLVDPVFYSGAEIPGLNVRKMTNVWWFNALYLGHYLLNDLVLLALNLVVDVMLVLRIRGDLRAKAKFSAAQGTAAEAEKRQKEQTSTERRTTKMLVYQLVMYLVCRFPELVFYAHFYFLDSAWALNVNHVPFIHICFSMSFCFFMANVIQYLYMLSYVVNVYFLYKFNRAFRNAFDEYIASRTRCFRGRQMTAA